MTIYPSTGRAPDDNGKTPRKLHFGGDSVIGQPGWNVPPTAQETMYHAQLNALQRQVFGDRDPADVVAESRAKVNRNARAKKEIARLEASLFRPTIQTSRRVPSPPKAATALHKRRQDAIAAARKRRAEKASLAASGNPTVRSVPTARWSKLPSGRYFDASLLSRADAIRVDRLGR